MDKADVASMEIMGSLGGAPVVHLTTHGGLNLIVCRKNGELRVLGSGAHRAFAKSMANSADPAIQWDTTLWKSEDAVITEDDSWDFDLNKHRTKAFYQGCELVSLLKIEKDFGTAKNLVHAAIMCFVESGMSQDRAWKEVENGKK
jgi:hypothetical protein